MVGMMPTVLLRKLLVSLIALGPALTLAAAAERGPEESPRSAANSEIYGDRDRGWHRYETPPKEPEPVPLPKPRPGDGGDQDAPAPFSVKWLQQKLEESKLRAMESGKPEDVELYITYQKLSMDMSERFANVYQTVVATNPELDETVQNPVVKTARTARRRVQEAEEKRVLDELAKTAGIYYFFKSTCQYCMQQNPVIKMITDAHDFSVLPVSIEGLPMATPYIKDYVVDQGQAAMLGVTSTPTLFLVHRDGTVAPLAIGVQSLPSLKSRILQVAYAQKWIEKEDLDAATKGSPKDLLLDAVIDSADDIDWDDPEQALRAFRELSITSVKKPGDEEANGLNVNQSTPLKERGNER